MAEDNKKSDITFNISGGNNQILPNATHAEQHFYGDNFVPSSRGPLGLDEECTPVEALTRYINNQEAISSYLSLLKQCTKAGQLADIIVKMALDDNVMVDKMEVVKGRFLETVIPLCNNLRSGNSVANIRQRVNDRLANLPRTQRG